MISIIKTKKEKIFRILSLVFAILTFIGAGYVLINKGEVNAGYAVIPSLFCVIFSQLSIFEKNKNLGMCFGSCFGSLIGIIIGIIISMITKGNIGIYMCFSIIIGMCIGMGIGSAIKNKKDSNNKK